MATDQERLVVSLEARVNQFEKNFKRANRAANQNFRKIERRSKQSGDRLEKTMAASAQRVSGAFKGLLAGVAAGGVAGVVGQIGRVAESIATIGDRAKQAGLDAQDFQRIAFVAEQNRIEVDDLTSGIREMQLRMNEFITSAGKSGTAAETLQRLGYTVDQIRTKLQDPLALFTEIVGKVEHLDRASQIRIFDDIFGGDGERIVRLIAEGERGIRAQIQAAEDLGIVLSDDVIAKAQEIDRQFNIVATTVGTALKGAIVEAASALSSFIDSFRNFENQHTRTLDSRLAEIGKQRLDLDNRILKLQGQQRDATAGDPFGYDYSDAIKILRDERRALGEEEQRILDVLNNRATALPPVTVTAPPPPTTSPTTEGGASRGGGTSNIERERQAVRDLIAELEHEKSLIGATDLQRQISNNLRQAGAAATADQQAQIVALVTAINAEQKAQERATNARREFANMAGSAVTGFIQDLRNGVSAGDALANMLNRVVDQIVQMAVQMAIVRPLMEGLGGTSFLGGIFGAKDGGVVEAAGGGHIRGPGTSTSDSIPARLSDGEFVVNAAATRKHGALLEAINSGKVASFATGGKVGKESGMVMAAANVSNVYSPTIKVNVEGGSSGDSKKDEEYADRIAANLDRMLDAKMAAWTQEQMRPGNSLNRGKKFS